MMRDGKRVLLLEDGKILQGAFVDALRSAGYVVEPSGSVEQTLKLLSEPESFDVIVLNIILPDGDGIELCARIRAKGIATPILMQSGYQLDYKIGPCLEAGVNAYLAKPFSMRELVHYVDLLSDLPDLIADHVKSHGRHGRNRPDADAYAAQMVDEAFARVEALQPLPGSYAAHPVVDGKPAPSIPFTEAQVDEFKKLLVEIKDHLENRPERADERRKLIAALAKLCQVLGSWIAGRATVVTDEFLKNLVKYGLVAYLAHATGLQQAALRLLAALAAQGGAGH